MSKWTDERRDEIDAAVKALNECEIDADGEMRAYNAFYVNADEYAEDMLAELDRRGNLIKTMVLALEEVRDEHIYCSQRSGDTYRASARASASCLLALIEAGSMELVHQGEDEDDVVARKVGA